MPVVFYDNLEPTPPDEDIPGVVEVERIYCFDWDRFRENDWQELSRIYETLPGSVRNPKSGPAWFGDDEEHPPFLWASVEPPGLQVYGVLPESDWLAWDERFRAAASGLPMRVMKW